MVRREIAQPFFMTVLEGFGMLGVGILALIIGGGIAFYVISKVMEDDDDDSIY